MREERDGGAARPGDEADKKNADDQRAADAVHHEEDGDDAAEKYPEPHLGRLEGVREAEGWMQGVGVCSSHTFENPNKSRSRPDE